MTDKIDAVNILENGDPIKSIADSKHFCILPWIHFHAWPDDRVMPCCIAESSTPVAEYQSGMDIMDIMNSDEYKKMRQLMLADEPYAPCQRCYDLEKVGTWSLRISQNTQQTNKERSAENVEENLKMLADTNEDGSIDEFKMKYMDIRFSNLCNFKCRSCGPGCSNLWGEEKIKLVDDGVWINRKGRDTLMSVNSDGAFMENLKPYLKDVQEVYFAGGEILVHPEHYECLDYWIENGMADKVRLNYTTNMSKITYQDKVKGERDLFDLWEHFPNIEMWASIDAIGKAGDMIRKGFRWERVKKNMLAIKERAPHIQLGFTPTISLWNVWHYSEMFDWLYDNGFTDIHNPPRLNMLTAPDWANISILPEKFRIELMREFRLYYEKFPKPEDSNMNDTFKMIMMTLRNGEEDRDKLREFFRENDVMDRMRGEELAETTPRLQEVREWIEQN
jgi:hypothetical protein